MCKSKKDDAEEGKVEDEEPSLPPVTLYVRHYRKVFDKMMLNGVIFGSLAIVIQLSNLMSAWDLRTSWLSKVPCTFQDQMASFAALTQATTKTIEFGVILPTIGFVLYGVYYLRPSNRKAIDTDWQPLNTCTLALLYAIKILVPIIVFSLINFKLPAYVPYKAMSLKACGVTASLALFPPGRDGAIINETYYELRSLYSNFLSHPANMEYSDFPSMEKNLIELVNAKPGTEKDDTEMCRALGSETTGALETLNVFLTPPSQITSFCEEGFRVADEELGMRLTDALEFPLKVLSSQFYNLFSAIPLAYLGCSRSMEDGAYDAPTGRVEPTALSFSDLCTAFYSSKSYGDFDDKYKAFASKAQHDQFSSAIRSLETEEKRQVACMVGAGLLDPRTGYDATAGFVCPPWLAHRTNGGTGAPLSSTLWLRQTMSHNPFAAAAAKGFYVWKVESSTPGSSNAEIRDARRWTELADVITDVMIELSNAGAISNVTKTETLRWTIRDPRSLVQLGKDQLLIYMNQLNAASNELKKNATDQVTASLSGLIDITEKEFNKSLSILDETFNNFSKVMNATFEDTLKKGGETITESITSQLTMLTYDLQLGVDSEWDISEGEQTSFPPPHQADDECYHTDQTKCEDDKCWWVDVSKHVDSDNPIQAICGWADVDFKSFRGEVWAHLNNNSKDLPYRIRQAVADSREAVEDMGSKLEDAGYIGVFNMFDAGEKSMKDLSSSTINHAKETSKDLIVSLAKQLLENINRVKNMKGDLSITSTVAMLKTSQLVSEKIFDATSSAIKLVRYVIGTYIGFSVVSRLLPFAMAIVAGVSKGTKASIQMTTASKAFEVPGDAESLAKFNALLLFISGLVVCVPMISVTIFFYQSYADQYFIMVVFAVEIWSVGQAFKGFLSARSNLAITALSGALGLSGFICWIILDEQAMFISEYLVDKALEHAQALNAIKILTVVANAGFNFFFSKVITAQIISRLSAEMFAHGVSGMVEYVERHPTRDGEEAKIVRKSSNLSSLDIWSKTVRERSHVLGKHAGSRDTWGSNPLASNQTRAVEMTTRPAEETTSRQGELFDTSRPAEEMTSVSAEKDLWEEHYSDEHQQTYYVHSLTRKSSWIKE
jgi:hypothetical protein